MRVFQFVEFGFSISGIRLAPSRQSMVFSEFWGHSCKGGRLAASTRVGNRSTNSVNASVTMP